MLIDMHIHTSGISHCSVIGYKEAVDQVREAGISGIVLTNHYQKHYVKDGDYDSFARRFVEEFSLARAYGDSVGVRVLFGAEVTMDKYNDAHLQLYGITESFIEDNPTLCHYTMEEMYRAVKSLPHPVAIVQAHPYRKGKGLLPLEYLDGVEINCSPMFLSYFSDMVELARESKLVLTSGSDYHGETYLPRCGIYLPDDITDSTCLGCYLLESPCYTLCVHEPNTDTPFDLEWKRS